MLLLAPSIPITVLVEVYLERVGEFRMLIVVSSFKDVV